MNGYGYLIPANSKKSLLIFNLFKPFDFVLFACGLGVTMVMLMIFELENMWITAMVLAPACICGFLVMPVANYHNIYTILQNAIIFLINNQRYRWRGWCFLNEKETEK